MVLLKVKRDKVLKNLEVEHFVVKKNNPQETNSRPGKK